jgi:hypothetical protein
MIGGAGARQKAITVDTKPEPIRSGVKSVAGWIQMANQRAIMFMVGQDDAQRVYL